MDAILLKFQENLEEMFLGTGSEQWDMDRNCHYSHIFKATSCINIYIWKVLFLNKLSNAEPVIKWCSLLWIT